MSSSIGSGASSETAYKIFISKCSKAKDGKHIWVRIQNPPLLGTDVNYVKKRYFGNEHP